MGLHRSDGLRIMTYNIRMDTGETLPGDPDHWPSRGPGALALMALHEPDLMGLQEVLPHQRADLMPALIGQYEVLGYGRDGGSHGEANLILVRRDRFEVLEWDQRWLSTTPDVIGSRDWDTGCTRIVVSARLRDRRDGSVLTHLNTHLDNASEQARREGAKILLATAKAAADRGDRVVLTGDFNCGSASPAHRILTETGDLLDAWDSAQAPAGPEVGSFIDYGEPQPGGVRIDWIMVSPEWQVLTCSLVTERPGGRWPSDHAPVVADLL
ncbi:endonuclease/exonuclease/phosphatase family protein [Devriesea agamarum]|uniref:endonuclease/exonuclease/phosphatase family protein n=1 Tax=Devriesea agamarum TaxID=472569 RepID=UPI00071C846F|nr:endonuclease/exonuclease/phosphatase family protein [Devriesea agamarum]